MIEKNSLEWELWKDAYKVRDELTPPPSYSQSGDYWKEALEKANEGNNKYKDTYLKALSENIFMGIILQLEEESKVKEQVQSIIKGVADKLTG